jgi:hypothetical protein
MVEVPAAFTEDDRMKEYHKRGYKYPPEEFLPNTTGWKNLMTGRMNQIEEMEDIAQRYEAFYKVVHSATLIPNFTEYGFGLAKCPDDLLSSLQQGVQDGLETAVPENGGTVIGPNEPLYVSRPDLIERVLHELHHYTEEWVGIPLVAQGAYGFRVYRNESKLCMHTDRIHTHVVSFILHVGSSNDADPWPIFIEDFHGRTHEITLTPGDMLFYESSKCFHGRPRPFNGSWYTSVFAHYYPVGDWSEQPHALDAHYAVPPEYRNDPIGVRNYDALEMIATAMCEPHCPNYWCNTVRDRVKWSGPAEDGMLMLPDMSRIPFSPRRKGISEDL